MGIQSKVTALLNSVANPLNTPSEFCAADIAVLLIPLLRGINDAKLITLTGHGHRVVAREARIELALRCDGCRPC